MKQFFMSDSKLSMARLTSFMSHIVGYTVAIISAVKGNANITTVSLVVALIGGGVTGKLFQKGKEK